jgi:exopolysaccharide production protein ExoZ
MMKIARLLAWRPGRPTPGHTELVGLQFIRGIAAVMVVLDHVSSMSSFTEFYGRHLFNSFPEAGAVGVQLFFCLSGFIILYVSVGADLRPKVAAGEFLKRRFARIIPFLWVVVLIFIIIIGRHGAFAVAPYIRALTLYPVGEVAPAVVWTLRHEFLFYLLFAATFLRVAHLRWAIVLWVLSPLALRLVASHPPELVRFIFNDANVLFGFGMLVGVVFIKNERRWILPAGAAVVLPAIAVLLEILTWRTQQNATRIGTVVALAVVSAVCVAVGAGIRESRTLIGALGKLLGDASYSIYLTHGLFVAAALHLMSHRLPRLSDAEILFTVSSAGIVGGIMLHFILERPIVSLTKRLMHARPRAHKPASELSLPPKPESRPA